MAKLRKFILSAVGLIALGIGGLILYTRTSPPSQPPNLGVTNGQLAPCPDSPNCVSTQSSTEQHGMDALPYTTSQETAAVILLDIINSMPRTELITSETDYIHATFRSQVFGFVDDVEFYIDPQANLVHFRSASRLGRSDLGVNRARMDEISQAFLAARERGAAGNATR
ncbi:MAG: DUF1499 domain-containing protein [Chloroflexales bacterium]|nr:DUF1499 domain-containing protein [Chloroflexales bacterium]